MKIAVIGSTHGIGLALVKAALADLQTSCFHRLNRLNLLARLLWSSSKQRLTVFLSLEENEKRRELWMQQEQER